MKNLFTTIIILMFIASSIIVKAQTTVTDYDGNTYTEVQIGNQIWLKENITSLHYSDGTEIPGVVAYQNNEDNAAIYGRLYTWSAAMNGESTEGAQGVCPCGYHVASDAEWTQLENFLGGTAVAGGKMKEAGTSHWLTPNTGADNSSGFTLLPGGEYDAHYTPNIFQFLHTTAVLWTSTSVSTTKARERYYSHDDAGRGIYDWYKTMKYSVRCIKDSETTAVGDEDEQIPNDFKILQNYPNPFNPSTTISFRIPEASNVNITIYDSLGRLVHTLLDEELSAGNHQVYFDTESVAGNLASGLYIYKIQTPKYFGMSKMLLLK